jgi:MFS family permease
LHVPPNSPAINDWVGIIFYVPAVAGGIFGLLGGYLTDLLGRRRVLVWSILLYALSALAPAIRRPCTGCCSGDARRCRRLRGVRRRGRMAVRTVPEPRQREAVVGYTQVLGSFGGLMVTGMYYLVVTYGEHLPLVRGGHEAWRYTLMSGIIPAIPLIVIRPFLPESPSWQLKKEAGTLKRPSFAELFDARFRKTTIVTTVMMAAAYAAAFGAIQQTPRIVPGLPEVRTLPRPAVEQTVSAVQSFQEFGGLTGRFLLAFLAVRIVSRRRLVRMFQVPGLILVPYRLRRVRHAKPDDAAVEHFPIRHHHGRAAQFLGKLSSARLPDLLEGTGESFAANVGGRMIGTCAALLTTQLVNVVPGDSPSAKLAYASAIVGGAAYLLGLIGSFWLPEPSREELPE